ncbi:MFS general substrate transporter [Daedalea quercina L-15889]|uniref:MFS general substrate transporter n=1 Tax=Daedalea quercina L-15889 TaxID=1314783 RepID=A0A165TBC3_9APHY|nr:MFS general substrate transporter [Daedalea quercina L-15889]
MSRLRTDHDNPTEETPLLQTDSANGHDGKGPVPITPLPRGQISILFVLLLVEPIFSQCIYPFINQLVSELDIIGGDEKKIGYYAGLIESIFYLTEVVFVIQWSRLSDYIGRKPVLLIGMAGATASMICFGLSKRFWQLVLSRCILGALNGNVGAMQSVVGELTDSTNMAKMFALMPVVWSVGATLASVRPLIGGQLARPHDRWPKVFANDFWRHYPYFLPCAVSASCSAFGFFIAALFMKETLNRKKTRPSSEAPEELESTTQTPIPLLTLARHPRVLLAVANYGSLCILDIAYRAVQPLFFATPCALGGLGLPPKTIGLILGSFGILNGALQALWFAPLVRRFGPKRVHMAGLGAFLPLWVLFPVIGALAREGGMTPWVWAAVMLQQVVSVVMDTAYGCVFMYITSSAPNRSSLGGTNGIGQLVAAFVRAIGPASATSLFAVSLERNWLGGGAVWLILIVVSCALWTVSIPLPRETWPREGDPTANDEVHRDRST